MSWMGRVQCLSWPQPPERRGETRGEGAPLPGGDVGTPLTTHWGGGSSERPQWNTDRPPRDRQAGEAWAPFSLHAVLAVPKRKCGDSGRHRTRTLCHSVTWAGTALSRRPGRVQPRLSFLTWESGWSSLSSLQTPHQAATSWVTAAGAWLATRGQPQGCRWGGHLPPSSPWGVGLRRAAALRGPAPGSPPAAGRVWPISRTAHTQPPHRPVSFKPRVSRATPRGRGRAQTPWCLLGGSAALPRS